MITKKWDSPEALRAYQSYANIWSDAPGFISFQYDPYNAGGGKVFWFNNRPILSPTFLMWTAIKGRGIGSPEQLAVQIDAMPKISEEVSEKNFALMVVNVWSKFGGLNPIQATDKVVSGLDPSFRVVTPTDLLWLMQLRLRPEETLTREIGKLPNSANKVRALSLMKAKRWKDAFEAAKLGR
jgi:hypothetical protein